MTTHLPAQYAPARRRRGLIVGLAVLVAVVLLAGAAAIAIVLLNGDDDGGPTYAQRDKICDLVDVNPLAALSLRERTIVGRTTARGMDGDHPYTNCDVQLDLAAPGAEPGAYDLRVGVVYHPDAKAATARFDVERSNAGSIEGAVRTDAPGVGDEAFFATSVLKSESDGTRSTLTTFHVVARHRNVVVEVNVGMARDSDWNQARVRDALAEITRALLGSL